MREIVGAAEAGKLVVHPCDMDPWNSGKATIFDFARHRRADHYGRISSQTGIIRPG